MNKLIELLNKYQEEKGSEIRFKRIDDSDFFVCGDDVGLGYETILSKKFGFIKWLVDNDKIDRERINDRWGDMSIHFTDEELFIMSLSISNTPIDDLISYLR